MELYKYLNNIILLYIHKQETDSLDLIFIAKEFVSHTLDVKVISEIFLFSHVYEQYSLLILMLICKKRFSSEYNTSKPRYIWEVGLLDN